MPQKRTRNAKQTRAALLEAAKGVFMRLGYEQAGVRDIADAAGVDKALVARYFGSKEKLFVEAVPDSFDIGPLLEGPRGELGERFIRSLLDPDKKRSASLMALLRSVGDPAAATLLRNGVRKGVLRPLAAWLGGADAEQRAAIIISQIAGLDLTINVMKLGPLNVPMRDREAITARLAPIIQRLVDPA